MKPMILTIFTAVGLLAAQNSTAPAKSATDSKNSTAPATAANSKKPVKRHGKKPATATSATAKSATDSSKPSTPAGK